MNCHRFRIYERIRLIQNFHLTKLNTIFKSFISEMIKKNFHQIELAKLKILELANQHKKNQHHMVVDLQTEENLSK